MNLVERAKNILITPKTEWPVIAGETDTLSSLLTSYVIFLAAIPAIAPLVAGLIITQGSVKFAVIAAVIAYASSLISYVATAYVVDLLAGSFNSEKNLDKSAQLVAYSATGSWVASLIAIIPVIGSLAALAGGIYSIYLMYLGVGPIKKTPADKSVVYVVIICVVMVAISMVIGAILGSILLAGTLF